ncbi:hypothetical protein SAMN05192566_0711 [Methylophilus rhizosphaerae]|uniref:Uncharacterized protein n=1 Tax=Methylophilus rhizosphaerae TaxID=492660 RepID=A0A1G9A8P9_9PROT|nr:hypothetical protein [Methylophilus rhizosphaerae]SDK22820.1 hypothetical protein SAMN05192566_0711 [Methylophilus rhizosphaerae]
MNTQVLLNHLKSKYPSHEFELENSQDFEGEDLPEQLISVIHEDMAIVDLFSSSCGRFEADPLKEYGINTEDAELLKQHNKVSL